MYRSLSIALLGATGLLVAGSAGAVTFTTTYDQTFDSLARTGTSSTLPEGWRITETGSNGNTTYAAGTGSDNTGNTYSFGAAGSSDRALGTLLSGTLVPSISASFTNGNAVAIADLSVAYVGEMYRLGVAGGRTDRLDVSYSIDGGTAIALDALDFITPSTAGAIGARNGNAAAYRTELATTLSGIDLAVGSTITFLWTDFNTTGADDGLAIDDFALVATLAETPAVPEPATWAMMIAGFGLVGSAMRRRRVGFAAL